MKKIGAAQLVDKSSVQKSLKKRISCKRATVRNFMCGIWSVQFNKTVNSTNIKIHCQETASEDCNSLRTLVCVSDL